MKYGRRQGDDRPPVFVEGAFSVYENSCGDTYQLVIDGKLVSWKFKHTKGSEDFRLWIIHWKKNGHLQMRKLQDRINLLVEEKYEIQLLLEKCNEI